MATIQNSSSFFAIGNASANSKPASPRTSGKSASRSSSDFSNSLQRAQTQPNQSNSSSPKDSQPVDQSAQNIQPQDQTPSNPQQTKSTSQDSSNQLESQDANQLTADIEEPLNTQDAPRNFTDENAITTESTAIAVSPILQKLPDVVPVEETVSGGGSLDGLILEDSQDTLQAPIQVEEISNENLNPNSTEQIQSSRQNLLNQHQIPTQLQSQIQTQLQNQIPNELQSQLQNQTQNQLPNQLQSQLQNQLPNQLQSQLQNQLIEQARPIVNELQTLENLPNASREIRPVIRENSANLDLQPVVRENFSMQTEQIPKEIESAIEIPNQQTEPLRLENIRTQFQAIMPISQESSQRDQSMLARLGGSMWDASQMNQINQAQIEIPTQIENPTFNQRNQIQSQMIQLQQNQPQIDSQIPTQQIQLEIQIPTQNQLPNQLQSQFQPQFDSTPVQSIINASVQVSNSNATEIDSTNSPLTQILAQQLDEIASEEIVHPRTESTLQNQSQNSIVSRGVDLIDLRLDQIIERPQQRSRNFSQSQNQNQMAQSDLPQRSHEILQPIRQQETFTQVDQPLQNLNATIDRPTQQIEQPQQIEQNFQPQQTQDPYNVREQIVQNARLLQRQGTTEMVIQLKPEHLGEMTLKISVSAEGAVTASFHSDNVVVRTIIENTLVQLKNDLANQGIKVDNVEVFSGLGGELLQQGQQDPSTWQNQSSQSQAANLGRINLEELAEEEVAAAYDSSAEISSPIGQNLSSEGGVNYLV